MNDNSAAILPHLRSVNLFVRAIEEFLKAVFNKSNVDT